MCNKAVNTDPFAIQFAADQYKTQEICVKICSFVFISVSDLYNTRELLKYSLNRHKTQEKV